MNTAAARTSYPRTQIPTSERPVSFNEKLNTGDRYWKFKSALQTILIITGFIGVGCIGWSMSTTSLMSDSLDWPSTLAMWPELLTFCISIVWCAVCILVFVLRKKPVHPGTRVALELLLWLGFVATALFVLLLWRSATEWHSRSDITYAPYDRGNYELANNGTWVWEPYHSRSSDDSDVSSVRGCDNNNTYSRNIFTNCAEQDAYMNKLWREKPHRANVLLTAVVCQFFGLVLHFALFVWACVDTNHYNRNKVSKDAEKLAAGIVQTMIDRGAILPPPGQAYTQPAGGQGMYYQLPPQQAYPLATMYPQRIPGQHEQMAPGQYRAASPAAPGPAVGPSNEKGQGPLYA
ncbi:uncharacterized protein K460DRAFT_275606 [Cucurbitaria berberidis CBS 394.84]|uniref:Uncharacterized protein n=1 Tax=Cucurbitaria berberidis CBS 394.84 TaxID=1168544 RepID=A0A9P4L9Y0_9PLEO|nr:uncharacterized protein K460DRAFT_275606 [Cucurbitaria berberidis CBS 394.84]KAF1847761.1 hypothetical protein K460DRAFT_275606 [Cucurbitaria berberidis CBS 394.84]